MPSLIVIYINDKDENVTNLIIKFTDDSQIIGKVGNHNDIEVLQRDLHELHKWSEDWQMLFNNDKCKTLHVGHNNPSHKYQINTIPLQQIDDEKLLLRHSLKVAQQVGAVVRKANQTLRVINRIFDFKENKELIQL
ncbi:uncharacterized protein [Procambarus clarkii]|uniref:uncharacterized protein n=1 Tax=Procambarus clarkii TaxID=6728 RepID=UPI003743BFD3